MANADLLTYEPRFDVDREQWFVDLDITTPPTPNLFIRLGLVRYQEHTIHPDLCVSEPVVVWSQLLPKRSVSVRVEETQVDGKNQTMPSQREGDGPGYSIVCEAQGWSHKGVQMPVDPRKASGKNPDQVRSDPDRLALPKVRFRLVHESSRDGVLRRIPMGYQEAYLKADAAKSRRLAEEALDASSAGDTLGCAALDDVKSESAASRCSVAFAVSKANVAALGEGQLYVYAEEVETYMPATYAREPAHLPDIFDPKTFVESGSRFAARINVELP